jgi:hypothetical protein
MANEFQFLPNPDNIPGKVSSGYQRQNTNMYAIQTGIDTTEPNDNGAGVVSVPAGGVVDLNGVMFKLTQDIALTKPDANTAYWVAVTDNGDGTATATLVTRPGVWSAAKLGCYRTDGSRTLNYVSLGDLSDLSEAPEYSSPQQKGRYRIQLSFGWKYAELASGMGNGPGINSSGGNPVPAVPIYKIWLHMNKDGLEIKIGANGGTGGNGALQYGTSIGAGGGGSGSGEYSEIRGILKTETLKPGAGANATSGRHFGGGGGSPGGSSGDTESSDGGMSGGFGSIEINGSYTYYEGGGGKYGGGNGKRGGSSDWSGGGGGQGLNGCDQPDDSPGGYCDIYALFN